MAATLVAMVLLLGAANACLLPPGGCFKDSCDKYAGMRIPGNGNWSNVALWTAPYDKLAFVRSSFNKKLSQNGPGRLTADTWLALLTRYPGYTQTTLPSLQFEYYEVDSPTVRSRAAAFDANIPTCCNGCRVTEGCNLYQYEPASYRGAALVTGGKCFFVSTGGSTTDGPFKWDSPTKRGTASLGSPTPLNRTMMTRLWGSGTFTATVDGSVYTLLFQGGYCNGNPGVINDPHFTGAHGTRFDFNGELNKAFCLITDKSLHLNAVLKGYKVENVAEDGKTIRSWIKEVGLIWADAQKQQHTLRLVARNGKEVARGDGFLSLAEFDGKKIAVPEAGASFKAADLTFAYLGATKNGWYDVDKFQVVVAGQLDLSFSMRVAHPKLRSPEDAEAHFNLMFNDLKVTPAVHGVLGQTYRNTPAQIQKAVKYSELSRLLGAPVKADAPGAGFLEGKVTDYESSSVLKADCKMSTFSV